MADFINELERLRVHAPADHEDSLNAIAHLARRCESENLYMRLMGD